MATTEVRLVTETTFDWRIVGLGGSFNSSNYISVGIATSQATQGSTSQPFGVISTLSAPTSRTSTSSPWKFESGSVSAGRTYTLYGYARAANGKYYRAGIVTFTTPSGDIVNPPDPDPTPTRPSNWAWTTTELSAFNNKGALSNLTHTRWNSFLDRINDFRVYKGYDAIAFNKMTSADKRLTATRFNQAKNAIGAIYSTEITDRSAGQVVYGSYFITLQNSLNSIT